MVGIETLTMSAPALAAARIWADVDSMSSVRVLVIVCTLTGASPPTATFPTWICLVGRRFIGELTLFNYFSTVNLDETPIALPFTVNSDMLAFIPILTESGSFSDETLMLLPFP